MSPRRQSAEKRTAKKQCKNCGEYFDALWDSNFSRRVYCKPKCRADAFHRGLYAERGCPTPELPEREREAMYRRFCEAYADGVLPEDLEARFGEYYRGFSRSGMPEELRKRREENIKLCLRSDREDTGKALWSNTSWTGESMHYMFVRRKSRQTPLRAS